LLLGRCLGLGDGPDQQRGQRGEQLCLRPVGQAGQRERSRAPRVPAKRVERYTGSWYDGELGWYWLITRVYDPSLERFLGPDRSQQEGIFTYIYAGDDPVHDGNKNGMVPAPIMVWDTNGVGGGIRASSYDMAPAAQANLQGWCPTVMGKTNEPSHRLPGVPATPAVRAPARPRPWPRPRRPSVLHHAPRRPAR
jgi:RHS repeat-associated protein